MVFTTHIFVFYFLPLFLLVYFNLPYRWRNGWITVASYVFYGWWQPWFVCLMMFTTVMDFIWGKVITRPGATRAQQRLAVTACVVTNLGFLGFFKYYMFGAATLNELLAAVGFGQFRVLRVVLPIGISFYTFHSLTYILDLYRATRRRRNRSPTSRPSWRCFRTWWRDRSSATRPWRRNWPSGSRR
jgi:alginate O-acetyltransferase complex protein AlgI